MVQNYKSNSAQICIILHMRQTLKQQITVENIKFIKFPNYNNCGRTKDHRIHVHTNLFVILPTKIINNYQTFNTCICTCIFKR